MDYLQYQKDNFGELTSLVVVLNLVINGLPSILRIKIINSKFRAINSFKPCYKWITFNTKFNSVWKNLMMTVLNLVINGLPSIPLGAFAAAIISCAYVLNLVINGLPSILNSIVYGKI